MINQKLSNLNINKLTLEQYNSALENGQLKDDEIYLVPTEVKDYAFKSDLETKADLVDGKIPLNQLPDNIGTNNPELSTINWENIQNKPQAYNPAEHNHNDLYYTKTEIENKKYLTSVPEEYITDTELNNKNFVKTSDLNNYYNKDSIDEKVTSLKNDDQLINQSIEGVLNQIDALNNSVQLKSNLVTEITDSSTDTQYPSAKIVNAKIKEIERKIPDTSNLQENNLTTSISETSTNLQYPSAKAVYDSLENIKGLIPDMNGYQEKNLVTSISEQSKDIEYPSAKAVYNELQKKQNSITIAATPEANNTNPVSAGGTWDAIENVRAVAQGRCQTFIRNDKEDLINWLSNEMDTSLLNKGDIFLLRAIDIPDYWWEPIDEIAILLDDDTTITTYTENDIVIEGKGVARVLETNKVPLNDYALKTELPTDVEKQTWNNKSDFDGKYSSLTNIPHISNQGNANGQIWYYPLGTMVIDNSGNYGNFIFTGRFGGWVNSNSATYTIMLMNRGDYSGDIITSTVSASGAISEALKLCDIIVSKNTDKSHTVYLKCQGYFLYDFDWSAYQHSINYNGTYTTTTPSNIVWTLSGAPKTMLDSNGQFSASGGINADYFGGKTLRLTYDIEDTGLDGTITFII